MRSPVGDRPPQDSATSDPNKGDGEMCRDVWAHAGLKPPVTRIPCARFSTPIEPPNSDRIREATAGPSPTSPPAVSDSPIDRRSKNLATTGAGSVARGQ